MERSGGEFTLVEQMGVAWDGVWEGGRKVEAWGGEVLRLSNFGGGEEGRTGRWNEEGIRGRQDWGNRERKYGRLDKGNSKRGKIIGRREGG